MGKGDLSRLKCESVHYFCVTTKSSVKKKEKECKINHIPLCMQPIVREKKQ